MASVSGADVATAHKARVTQPRVLGYPKDLLCAQPAPCVALSKLPEWREGGYSWSGAKKVKK